MDTFPATQAELCQRILGDTLKRIVRDLGSSSDFVDRLPPDKLMQTAAVWRTGSMVKPGLDELAHYLQSVIDEEKAAPGTISIASDFIQRRGKLYQLAQFFHHIPMLPELIMQTDSMQGEEKLAALHLLYEFCTGESANEAP